MKLAEYLAKKGITHDAFARQIGTSQVTVTRYATGQRFPRPKQLIRIAAATKGAVTANDFVEHDERIWP